MGALPGLATAAQSLVAHGGTVGLIAETGIVVAGLALLGFVLRRSAKRERERERGGP